MKSQTRDSGTSGPWARYRQALETGELREDEAQAEAVRNLQAVHDALMARDKPSDWRCWWRQLLPGRSAEPVEGLYMWGGVGRGKTCLMDLFFHSLPGERRLRMHFHRFMVMVHRQLNERRGARDPLKAIGRELGEHYDVVCFDEFFVSDIGDAMLLAGLLEAMFEAGVTLVATSNLPPKRLYENGLQRQQFIPAIRLIERRTRVLNVDGGQDYRLQNLELAALWFSPLDEAAEAALAACFTRLAGTLEVEDDATIEVLGRRLKTRRLADDLVWFDFSVLCEGPRSAADYVELAKEYHTVLLSGVPAMDAGRDNAARRFIALVDEFYDHGVKLVISAEVPVESLYQGQELAFAFERTKSRLMEMQGHAYLARAHRP